MEMMTKTLKMDIPDSKQHQNTHSINSIHLKVVSLSQHLVRPCLSQPADLHDITKSQFLLEACSNVRTRTRSRQKKRGMSRHTGCGHSDAHREAVSSSEKRLVADLFTIVVVVVVLFLALGVYLC